MKNKIKISISVVVSTFLIGCGDGGGSPSENQINIDDYKDYNTSDLTNLVGDAAMFSFINQDFIVETNEENVTDVNWGAPDYTLIAVEARTFIAPNFEDENITTNTYTYDLILDYGGDGSYSSLYSNFNRGKVYETIEWDKQINDPSNPIQFEGLKDTASYPQAIDSNLYPGFFSASLDYSDKDHPQNNYTIDREYITHDDTQNLFMIVRSSKKSEVIIDVVEKGKKNIGYKVSFADEDNFRSVNITWMKDFKLDNGKSTGVELTIPLGDETNATLDTNNIYDDRDFYQNFEVISSSNYNTDVSVGSINNPKYTQSARAVQLGNIGDGEYYNNTKKMYQDIICDISGSGYATFDTNGNITKCVEDVQHNSNYITTEYLWLDEWRVKSRTTIENKNGVDIKTRDDFTYNEYGTISRMITYINDVYKNHKKYVYQRQNSHTVPN